MVGFGNKSLAGMEGTFPFGGRSHSQVADAHIDTYYLGLCLRSWACYLHLQTDEQVKLLLGLLVPELSGSDMRAMLEQSHMLAIACVGHDHTSLQREDAHLLLRLQAVVSMEVVGERGRHIRGRMIQSFVAFLGLACLAGLGILLHLCPERLVRGSDLARNIA